MSCGVARRCGSDPTLLWLWYRPAAIAPIGPLVWEPPYASGAALEKAKKKKKKKINIQKSVAVLYTNKEILEKEYKGVPIVVQQKRIQLGTMRLRVRHLALLSGLRIWCCHELWCRSQTPLGPRIAVAMAVVRASGCRSDSNLSPGTSMCCRCTPKKRGKKSITLVL